MTMRRILGRGAAESVGQMKSRKTIKRSRIFRLTNDIWICLRGDGSQPLDASPNVNGGLRIPMNHLQVARSERSQKRSGSGARRKGIHHQRFSNRVAIR